MCANTNEEATTTVDRADTGGRPSRGWMQSSRAVAAIALLLGTSACGNEVTKAGSSGEVTSGGEEMKRCRPASKDGILSNDQEIASFAGCQVLEGSLQVNNTVTDISPLSSLQVIEGDISGGGYRIKPIPLDALHNLEVVGGDMHFFSDNVTSFKGLSKLHTVGGWLRVLEAPELVDLRGLEKVRSLSRLDIEYNPKLRTLAGLDGLEEVKGDVSIQGNAQLPASEVDVFLLRVQVGGDVIRD